MDGRHIDDNRFDAPGRRRDGDVACVALIDPEHFRTGNSATTRTLAGIGKIPQAQANRAVAQWSRPGQSSFINWWGHSVRTGMNRTGNRGGWLV
ncbi:hypothetical protein Bsp3421_001986 [Burkholderia sp. FERM BP-3421]|jgi:hypothetical protein|uniref:hypothetical protein n=1 Tax=Burkholderia sp. FERM BP-3421 TaxID=1494466 RepID=UPI0023623DF7|nr:hypothetical protein [Burkholderia sp. FERM BP-3421]WDD92021.1 hypothetical protein Bsp3421_001986 [Burkholderia sp. FERM BP-3421]